MPKRRRSGIRELRPSLTSRTAVAVTAKIPAFLAVDFFCGAGGTTRGLLDAGGYVIAGVDKDSGCDRTYTDNNGNDTLDRKPPHYLCRDIFPAASSYPEGQQEKLKKELQALIGKYRELAPGVPVLFAICAPCQPFTTLARKELSEGRIIRRRKDKNLLSEALKFVRYFRPDIVLSENVAGISDPKFGGIWNTFFRGLRASGYAVGSDVICASDFGVPQFRRRSILVAVRKNRAKGAAATSGMLSIPASSIAGAPVSVSEAIAHLPPIAAGEQHRSIPNHRARRLSDLNIKRISSAKPGVSNNYLFSTPFGDLSLPCHRRVKERLKISCFTDVYTRMSGERPSPTITTKCHSISNGRFGHFDSTQNRGISLREAAALQSFRDDYVFYPETGVCSVARMIGNAVPPLLAKAFAEFSLTQLDGRSFARARHNSLNLVRGNDNEA